MRMCPLSGGKPSVSGRSFRIDVWDYTKPFDQEPIAHFVSGSQKGYTEMTAFQGGRSQLPLNGEVVTQDVFQVCIHYESN